tara:strand:+ start:936 stop:1787 length:852 start_codon:yes stop_codon:yes gene_type:complete
MEKLYIFIIFIISFIVYKHLLWYVPLTIDIYTNEDKINIIDSKDNIKNFFYKPYPIITDARQLFRYEWSNFELPLSWLNENLVSGEILLKDGNINHETNLSYSKREDKHDYLSMFHHTKYNELKASIYNFFSIPHFFKNYYSTYVNDLIVNESKHFVTPWFLNKQTYHIFYIIKGNVTFQFLSRNFYLSNKKKIKQENIFHYLTDEYSFETLNVDETNYNQEQHIVHCKENSLIIVPYYWIYSIKFNDNAIILNYYYKSILNTIADNYLNLKHLIENNINDKN